MVPINNGPITTPQINYGEVADAADMNKVFSRIDLAQYNGLPYGIYQGLGITYGASLTITVAAGQANVGGLVDFPGGTLAVPDNHFTSGHWVAVWLYRTGGLTTVLDSNAAPGLPAVFLGKVLTNGGVVTAWDISGVVFLYGGKGYRATADSGPPTDTPPSNTTINTRTAYTLYEWDPQAGAHIAQGLPAGIISSSNMFANNVIPATALGVGIPSIIYHDLVYTDFFAAAMTNTITALTIPINMMVLLTFARVLVPAAGTGIATLTYQCDIGLGGGSGLISNFDGTVLSGGPIEVGTGTPFPNYASSRVIGINATSTGANLNALTTGDVRVWAFVVTLP